MTDASSNGNDLPGLTERRDIQATVVEEGSLSSLVGPNRTPVFLSKRGLCVRWAGSYLCIYAVAFESKLEV